MRKSSILIILLIGTLFMLTPTESNKNNTDFNDWRPEGGDTGCHVGGTTYAHVSGSILFNSSWLTVEANQEFALLTTVVNFDGNLADSSDDITVGFNLLDGNNSDFLTGTIAESVHLLDENGTSDTPWEAVFIAPEETGNYTLIAYGVAGGTGPAYFDWVIGQVRIEVVESSGPPGPSFNLDIGEITIDNVNVTIDIVNLTDVKTIELAVDEGNYSEITLVSSYKYQLDLSNLTAGEHVISVKVTNLADASTIKTIIVTVPQISTSTTATTTTTTPTSITPQETITDTVDYGVLSNPAILGALVVVMIIAITGPWILLRKS
ncbi:MAG: hypothetical protein GPJ54_09560 [Candidatus Heimdallarchaeota archaeon]|nr:hypothetical protein [Candidatus Heimdallarchaeota archaeon]